MNVHVVCKVVNIELTGHRALVSSQQQIRHRNQTIKKQKQKYVNITASS